MRRVMALVAIICLLLTSCTNKEPGKDIDITSEPSSSVSSEGDKNTPSDESTDSNTEDELFSGSLTGTIKVNTVDTDVQEVTKSVFVNTQSGGYDAKAKTLRDKISKSQSKYDITGTTYYISPKGDDFNSGTSPEDAWQTLDALMVNGFLFEPGDAILFERGGVYRANTSVIISTSNITFGAYGEGVKPCLYGSQLNYANTDIWVSSNKKNIWKMDFPLRDAGIMVFNNGEFGGIKKNGLASMKENGHFYHNTKEKTLYLYCDKGNPGKVWENIEIGTDQRIISVYGNKHDITIDNICFKYTGAHAIDFFENNYNIKVTNCEFGWIGGSVPSGVTRYGNAIQFWDSCWNVEIKNNWIYQVYDAGITFQYSIYGNDGGWYHDIEFSNNLIEYCTYSIEIFTSLPDGYMKNITIDSNVMRFAGYGIGNQRPDSINVSHICGWNQNYGEAVENFIIKNNIFDCSTTQIIDWASGNEPLVGFNVFGNTFYQKAYAGNPVMNFSVAGYTYATNQSELETAIATFDKSPKLVKWLE